MKLVVLIWTLEYSMDHCSYLSPAKAKYWVNTLCLKPKEVEICYTDEKFNMKAGKECGVFIYTLS